MTHDILNAPRGCRALTLIAGACLALSLQGCIDRDHHDDGGGSTTGGDTTPGACANLPASTTTYKGGDALGEELTLSLDPATLAYTITLDASVQRTAGTQLTGTLTQLDGCTYTSEETGAEFTLAANGVVQGGAKTPAGTSFAPLLAFATTYNNASAPTVFNDVALTFNAAGLQTTAGTTISYGGSGRIRNAGTMQFCDATANSGSWLNGCSTEKGYFVYNSTRDAFDYFATDPTAPLINNQTGGTAAGSMVLGVVNGVNVGVFLRRVSATDFGMRLLTVQTSLASGTADGNYLVVDSSGGNASATWSGSNFTRGTDTATLTYDSPSTGVVAAAGTTLTGNLIFGAGIYGFVPSGSGAAFELGVAN